MASNKVACVAIVKNEQRSICEWIAHHIAVGFDTIIIYDNMSTDETVNLVKTFSRDYDVRLLEWPTTTSDYQLLCYEHAATTFAEEFGWVAYFDADEFLVINPSFDLHGILNLWSNEAAIAISWAIFGSSGHTEMPSGLITETFLYRAESSFPPNRHIKSIIRPNRIIRCENPHYFVVDGEYRTLSGRALTFSEPGLIETAPEYDLGKLHHYFTRSRAHWREKMQRGYHDTTRENDEFDLYDRNDVFDDGAVRYAQQVREILRRMDRHVSTTLQREQMTASDKSRPTSTAIHLARANIPSPSALITEFGTLLCWNPSDETFCHRPPGDIGSFLPVFCRSALEDELILEHRNQIDLLDPHTGRRATPILATRMTIVTDNNSREIGFDLGGHFISARKGDAEYSAGAVALNVPSYQAWEKFTPLPREATNDLIALASDAWIIRNHPNHPPAAKFDIRSRHQLAILDRVYPIEGNLPLIEPIRSPTGRISSLVLMRDGWKVDELIRYHPLIAFVLFGNGAIAEQLRIAADSLSRFGKYDGEILVIGDQPAEVVLGLFPESMRNRVKMRRASAVDRLDHVGARLMLGDIPGISEYQPVLYADTDVVFDTPIHPILQILALQDRMSAQAESANPLPHSESVGGPLFAEDPTPVEGLVGFNAGIWGFPNLMEHGRALRLILRALREHVRRNGRGGLPWMDQSMANYVTRKLCVFDNEPLTDAVRVPKFQTLPDARTPRGFVHFWAYDGNAENRANAMRSYTEALSKNNSPAAE